MFGLRVSGFGGTGGPGSECLQNVSFIASSEQRYSRQDPSHRYRSDAHRDCQPWARHRQQTNVYRTSVCMKEIMKHRPEAPSSPSPAIEQTDSEN